MLAEPAPYLRIAADLRRRISAGELRPGDRVPSTRALVRDWGVAMATAAKALSVLGEQGWVRAVPGSGTVVAERAPVKPPLGRDGLVRAAVALADAEGLAALSMRRLAAEVGVGPMALYRHVPDKDELLRLMADAALGEAELPEPGPVPWRPRLELAARAQWSAYRRHPWLAPILLNSLVRPPIVASGLRLVDWSLRALAGTGLRRRVKLQVIMTLNGWVGGLAVSNSFEVQTEQESGISGDQRLEADQSLLLGYLQSGRFPELAEVLTGLDDVDLDEAFEFGLRRQLDGIGVLLGEHQQG
ncbi:TetR/AcrR family transcriptional regulator C-terminal domain-containing protein [Amycolatopsis sp. A133]|uniref:TetR/AcrR family transcriptional regulator C-terminal domain-containing protein n=1 Tax=Amycolatopsis sp. A133 TaxID=3064472 RepID=UPI0027E93D5B|nr:TetR/AcrR family transcriptional regulator C-terminal domain-containing protein [Amycolatopsis sp. A133]MDQ7802558.1 TetR/AcrR family transcriptional regulator C-terminal domain-containing protein [Amycolatopsis sp. A133]